MELARDFLLNCCQQYNNMTTSEFVELTKYFDLVHFCCHNQKQNVLNSPDSGLEMIGFVF